MKRMILILAVSAMVFQFPQTAFAYTENDLRELMGLERIEGEKWEETAAGILAQCADEESYNELADLLDTAVFKDELAAAIEDKNRAYRNYRKQFLEGKEAQGLLEALFAYDSLYRQVNSSTDDPSLDGAVKRYDSGSIERQAAYARALLALCNSRTDIGMAGPEADTFLKRNLRIQNMTEDALTCYVAEGESIYAQLGGTVYKEGDTLLIRSGAATVFRYTGVTPVVSDGQQVEQYQLIGKAAGGTVTVRLLTGGLAVNPLKMYGTRARYWQDEYLRTQPWNTGEALDLADVKDSVSSAAADDSGNSVMTDRDGKQTEIVIENNTYRPKAGMILDETAVLQEQQED